MEETQRRKKLVDEETRLLRQRVHVINEIHVGEAKNRDLTPRYRFLSLGLVAFRENSEIAYSLPNGARSNRN